MFMLTPHDFARFFAKRMLLDCLPHLVQPSVYSTPPLVDTLQIGGESNGVGRACLGLLHGASGGQLGVDAGEQTPRRLAIEREH